MPSGLLGTGAERAIRASKGVCSSRIPRGVGKDHKERGAGKAATYLPVHRRSTRRGDIATHVRRHRLWLPAEKVAQTPAVSDRELHDHPKFFDVPSPKGSGRFAVPSRQGTAVRADRTGSRPISRLRRHRRI